MILRLQPLLTLKPNEVALRKKSTRHLDSEIGTTQVSSLDSGQVLRQGATGQNWQFAPKRRFSVENEEAEMQAWQFHGSCRFPLHLVHPGHPDLSCLVTIAQPCLDGILLLGHKRHHCGSWGKYKMRHGSVFHCVCEPIVSEGKVAASCQHSLSFAATFSAGLSGGQWWCFDSCHVVFFIFFILPGKQWESQSIYHLESRYASVPPVLPTKRE